MTNKKNYLINLSDSNLLCLTQFGKGLYYIPHFTNIPPITDCYNNLFQRAKFDIWTGSLIKKHLLCNFAPLKLTHPLLVIPPPPHYYKQNQTLFSRFILLKQRDFKLCLMAYVFACHTNSYKSLYSSY